MEEDPSELAPEIDGENPEEYEDIITETEEEVIVEDEQLPEVDPPYVPAPIKIEDIDHAAEMIGVVHTNFPENKNPEFEGITNFPQRYYTISGKEKLLLLFAENFRRQQITKYPKRKPPVMVLKNECNVQKFVSTTLKPTRFIYPDLIDSWENMALFVADHIIYEPLEQPDVMPNRLISPDTLLRTRRGNSFEMATLLASMLIGSGYAACVVSGYATREVTLNDQRRVQCPFIPAPDEFEDKEEVVEKEPNKYALKEPPDLTSKFLLEVEERNRAKLQMRLLKAQQEAEAEKEAAEKLEEDPFHGKRVHAWVVIIRFAPWSIKPSDKVVVKDGEEPPQPTPIYIEPSTGNSFEPTNLSYLGIESIWNQYNYYINRQEPITNVEEMQWNLGNTEHWEHLLAGVPFDLRVERPLPEDMEALSVAEEISKEKHLDMPVSWVAKLDIQLPDFEQRYPNGYKIIHYKQATYEQFAPYKMKDGLVKRLTLYETVNYENPEYRWEWFDRRTDHLLLVKINYQTKEIDEYFSKGRADNIKKFSHNAEPLKEKILTFFHVNRLDSLMQLVINLFSIKEYYFKRRDFLKFREYTITERTLDAVEPKTVTQIIEHFDRNESIKASKNIAIRVFNLIDDEIFLKFHYEKDAITASTRKFIKPLKPGYGCEIPWQPELTFGYNADPVAPPPTEVELYLLLLQQLTEEEKSKKSFDTRCRYIDEILYARKEEMSHPKLYFDIFDDLRNNAARVLRLAQYENMKKREAITAVSDPDFLAPYLVKFENRVPNRDESLLALELCLNDSKDYYLDLLNELQRRYDELVSEAKHFKRFLNKFHEQFDDFDYERLLKEGESIEINKRMVQQRLINTREESQRQYNELKEKLLTDERLNFEIDEHHQ